MSNDPFTDFLKELETFFQCPLKPDRDDTCLIGLDSGLNILLKFDASKQKVEVSTRFGPLPSFGNYRETLFKEALKSNNLYPREPGIFAFSAASNHLILSSLIDLEEVSLQKITAILTPFITKAKIWSEAFNHGETPVIEVTAPHQSGLFGILQK